MKINGFIANPNHITNQTKQYFYVNKRIINNKIVKHAIMQAYQDNINDIKIKPCYLLYLTIEFNKVDINYHPNKKDIRFYEERFVHDFIYQSIFDCLKKNNCVYKEKKQNIKKTSGINIFNKITCDVKYLKNISEKKILKKNNFSLKIFGKLLTIIDCYAVFEKDKKISFVSIYYAKKFLLEKKILSDIKNVKKLLKPLKLNFYKINSLQCTLMKKIGIKLQIIDNQIFIWSVPIFFYEKRNTVIAQLIDFVSILDIDNIDNIVSWIVNKLIGKNKYFNYLETMIILSDIEKYYSEIIINSLQGLIKIINIDDMIIK